MVDEHPRAPEFDDELIQSLPKLRAYALKLSGKATAADDLVQTAVLRAVRAHGSFVPGSNMKAWLTTILRNEFLSGRRVAKREVEDVDGAYSGQLKTRPGQMAAYDLKIMLGQLERLKPRQRACFELIVFDQLEYEEVAELMGVPVGTVKSIVSRARDFLVSMDSTYLDDQ